MHYTVAHDLCRNNEQIALPFTSSHYWRRGKKLNTMVKRRSMMLAFGKFRQCLKETSTWYTSPSDAGGSEAYTSKQCGICGTLNDKLGGSEIFKCCSCGVMADRDVHAARNILMRFLA
jgi:transposase